MSVRSAATADSSIERPAVRIGEIFQTVRGHAIRSPDAVAHFYRERENRLAWTDRTNLQHLMSAIGNAAAHGLAPADYHADAFHQAFEDGDTNAVEILATDAYLTLGAHLLRGKVDPDSVEPNWTASRRSGDVIAHLSQALKTNSVEASLEGLAPPFPSYKALQTALRKFSRILSAAAWPSIPDGPLLKVGMRGPRVAALRKRLRAEGLLQRTANVADDRFDSATEEAVGAFQRGIGLEADGIVGPLTRQELNRSPAERVAQIRANLERWRWLGEDLGPRHIRVNIAEFRLETWVDGRPRDAHDIIIGRSYRKTPVFSGSLSYLIFNPWWETPRRLARLDKLPAFKEDPESVERLGFEVFNLAGEKLDASTINWNDYSSSNFPFRLRQRPGPHNAMGVVKFMFPNPHDVYLHDTPTRELFSRSKRDFSSGCIRVDHALDFAEWVLSGTRGWDRRKIEATVASGRETRVDLAAKVPVHILYMTVVRNRDGTVRFLADLYDRDGPLIAALDKTPPGQ